MIQKKIQKTRATILRQRVKESRPVQVEIRNSDERRSKDYCQRVHEVAFSLYEQRGCVGGYDLDDWLRAEEIVKNQEEAQELAEHLN
jgi:hypothetical protein